jgi:hypothetical protein
MEAFHDLRKGRRSLKKVAFAVDRYLKFTRHVSS